MTRIDWKLQTARHLFNGLAPVAPKWTGNQAVTIMCNPRFGRYEAEEIPRIFEAAKQPRVHTKNGDAVHYYHWGGNNQKVLLLHGWESNALRWEALLVQLLASGFEVVALDSPAQGLSGGDYFSIFKYVQFIEAVCKSWSPETIIGHSAGAMAGAYLFASESHQPIVEKTNSFVGLAFPSRLEYIFNLFVKHIGWSEKVQSAAHNAFAKRFPMAIRNVDFEKQLLPLRYPTTLLIHDPADEVSPISGARALANSWKNVRLQEVNGLGHSLKGNQVYNIVLRELIDKSN